MTARNSTKARRNCFDRWKRTDDDGRIVLFCQQCGIKMNPAADRWEADHVILHVYDGTDDAANLQPLCYVCHREKSGKDKSFIAKGQRQSDSVYGVKRSKRPMMGSIASGWKKTFSNGWVRR